MAEDLETGVLTRNVDLCVKDFLREYDGRKPTDAFVDTATFNRLNNAEAILTCFQKKRGNFDCLGNNLGLLINLHRLSDGESNEQLAEFGERIGVNGIRQMESPMILTRDGWFKKHKYYSKHELAY